MKQLILVGTLALGLLVSSNAGAAQADPCSDGAPGYADALVEIGEELTTAAEGSFADILQAADQGFERLVTLDPPTAFEAPHAYMLSALHNLAMASMADGLGQPEIAETYNDAAAERLEQFNESYPEALADCGI